MHISHMLWGGLDMLIALIVALTFLGRRAQVVASVLGGIGFGTFIDELGKFITSSNDYFFQPTLFLIYAIYIVLFLAFLLLERSPQISRQEHLATSLYKLAEANMPSLHEQDKKELLSLLGVHNDTQEKQLQWLADTVKHRPLLVILFFIGYALLLGALGGMHLKVGNEAINVVEAGWLASSIVSYSMMLVGIFYLQRSPPTALIWLRRAIFVSIFLTQTFLVLIQPITALVALLVNLIVLATLKYFTRSCSTSS